LDNLGAHRRVRQLIEDRDCEFIYLPPYSPDLNPIEEAFSKMKHVLRKIGARTKETLIEAMSGALAAVSAEDVRGFFVHHSNRAPVAATIKDAVRRYLTMDSFQGVQTSDPQRSRR
jgi:transposase